MKSRIQTALKMRRTAAEKGKGKAYLPPCPDTPLDPDVWSNLPSDLMGIVLSKTPFPSLAKFRTVSKHWKEILVPNAVRVNRLRGATMLLCQPRLTEYDNMDLSVIFPGELLALPCSSGGGGASPSHKFEPQPLLDLLFPDHQSRCLVASEGGLLFFAARDFNLKRNSMMWKKLLLVWNPVTQQHKILCIPPTMMSNKDYFVKRPRVGVVASAETGNYKLVLAGDLDLFKTNHILLLYDSSSNSWRRTEWTPQPVVWQPIRGCLRAARSFMRGGVSHNDDIYFTVKTFLVAIPHNVNEVIKFNVRSETWTKVGEIQDPFPNPSHFRDVSFRTADNHSQIRLLADFSSRIGKWKMIPNRKLGGDHGVEFNPDNLTDSEMRVTAEKFFSNRNQPGVVSAIEYFGFRQEGKFYNVMYLRDTEMHQGMPWKDVGVVVHEPGKHPDIYFYLKDSISSDILYDFFAFSPSLIAVV